MILSFIFTHVNLIMLCFCVILLGIVFVRFFRPSLLKNLSYFYLVIVSILLNIIYGSFLTWAQYYVWSNAGDSRVSFLVNSPLSKDTPIWEWLRPVFENNLGYFLHYAWTNFWLNVLICFIVSFALYFIFRLWQKHRGNLLPDGPVLLLILMLIVGWPGILLFIPLGFLISLLGFVFYRLKGKYYIYIEPMFIISSLITILFEKQIFKLISMIY